MTNTDALVKSYYDLAEAEGYGEDPGIDGLALFEGDLTAIFQVTDWSGAEVRVLVVSWIDDPRAEDPDEPQILTERSLARPEPEELRSALRDAAATVGDSA